MQNRSKIIVTLLSLCGIATKMSALDKFVSSDTQKLVKKGFVYTGLAGGCGVVAYHTYKFAFGNDERDGKRKAAILRASINEQVKAQFDSAIAAKTLVTQADIAEGRKAVQDVQLLREELDRLKKEMTSKVDSAAGDVTTKAKQLFASDIAKFDGRLNAFDIASKTYTRTTDLADAKKTLQEEIALLSKKIEIVKTDLEGSIAKLAKPDTSSDKKDGAAL